MSANIYPSGQDRQGQGGRRRWVLQERGVLPNQKRYWTVDQDYNADPAKALNFPSSAEANRWLWAHKHLRGSLEPIEVFLPEAKSNER